MQGASFVTDRRYTKDLLYIEKSKGLDFLDGFFVVVVFFLVCMNFFQAFWPV